MKVASKVQKFAKAMVTRTLEFELERMPFRLENVSLKKLLASICSEINCALPKPGRPWYPIRLQIEPSSACTLHCPLCPLGKGVMTRPRTNMSLPVFRSIIDELGDYAVYLQLWMYGEPCINPKLPDMIAYAKSKNIGISTSTNGQHVQTREEAEMLVASGLDNIIIAVDGADEESFLKYRVGGELRKVLRCMELIRDAKARLGSDKPGVNARVVVMKQNEHELDEIERTARQHGANMFSKKTAFASDHSGDMLDEQYLPENSRYRRFSYQNGVRAGNLGYRFRCRRPFDRISITAEGVVLSCEYDYNQLVPFGHGGNGDSWMRIWREQTATAFRKQFLKDETVYSFCANCSCGWIGPKESTTAELVHINA